MIHVIVVTYNSSHVVDVCLRGIVSQDDIHVTVVDNDSVDGTPDLVRVRYPSVEVIESGANLGFAKAVNLGAAQNRGELILLLNPDAELGAEELRTMARRMAQDEMIGIAAPHISQPGDHLEILEVGHLPSIWRVFTHYSGLSRFSGKLPGLEGLYLLRRFKPASREVEWVTGAVLMIRRDLFDQLGGLTTRWFMYAEDIDLCFRVHSQGYKIMYFADIPALHVMGGSDQQKMSVTNSAPFINLLDFYANSMAKGRFSVFIWRTVVVTGLISRSIGYRFKSSRAPEPEKAHWRERSRTFADYARDLRRVRLT